MRCDEVAALLPEAGRRRTPVDLAVRAPHRVVPALPGRARPLPALLRSLQLLRTRYVEPTPGLLGETLAALDRRRRAPARSARCCHGRRLAYAGAIGGAARRRPRPPPRS